MQTRFYNFNANGVSATEEEMKEKLRYDLMITIFRGRHMHLDVERGEMAAFTTCQSVIWQRNRYGEEE